MIKLARGYSYKPQFSYYNLVSLLYPYQIKPLFQTGVKVREIRFHNPWKKAPRRIQGFLQGLVAFGVPPFWEFFLEFPEGNVQPIQAAFRAGISCLAIRILAAPRKRKMTRKAPRRSLGNQKRFFETNDDFLGLREIWRHFLALVEGEYLKMAQVYVNLFGPLVMRTWYCSMSSSKHPRMPQEDTFERWRAEGICTASESRLFRRCFTFTPEEMIQFD